MTKNKQSKNNNIKTISQSDGKPFRKLSIEALEVRYLLNASGWDIAIVDEALDSTDILQDIASADDVIMFNRNDHSPLDILDMVEDLARETGKQIDSLALFSHGIEGAFTLGNEVICLDNLNEIEGALSEIGDLLAEDANVYIASCDTGSGEGGQNLVNRLSSVLAADVYASNDITGFGGDWQLEVASAGSDHAVVEPFNAEAGALYEYSLGTNILTNGDFEQPDTGLISNNWGLVPGWTSDTNPVNSGVFPEFVGQGYSGFIRDNDPSVYQTTSTAIQADKTYILTFKTTDHHTDLNNDDAADGGAELKASIYYDNAGSRVELATDTFTEIIYNETIMDQSIYSVVFRTDDLPGAIGNNIGVEFDNVSPVAEAGDSWIHVDDAVLEVYDDTTYTSQADGTNLVTNADFELPSSGKISTDWGLIPGWSSDSAPADSGVEEKYPGMGYSASIRDTDPSVYQTTSTVIEANTQYTLTFLANDPWTDLENNGSGDAEAIIQATIYYLDGATRTAVSTGTFDDLYFSWSEIDPTRYTVTFNSSDVPAAVGNNIGIEFDNVTAGSTPGYSWINIDYVSLVATNETTISSEFFEVGTIDETTTTSISDTVNGINVNYNLVSSNGHFLDEHANTTITNSTLKDIFQFTSDTSMEYLKLTSSALQAELNLTWETTSQHVYLAVTDVDLDVDIVTLLDGQGVPLLENRYIGTYDPASELDATARYVFDSSTGQFNNSVNEWTGEYFSVFDVSGLTDLSIFVGGNPGADTSFMGYALIVVDNAPQAVDDTAATNEDTFVDIDVVSNDIDAGKNGFTISNLTNPANGSLVDNGDGTVRYTPDLNFNGTDTFTYTILNEYGSSSTATVTVTVNAVNDAPVGVNDSLTVTEDTPVTSGNLLTNDSDVDGDGLSISAVSDGTHGTVVNNGDGTVTYTPAANYNGADTFTYTASDGNGGTDVVTVNVTVNAVNDVPIGSDDTITVSEDIISVSGNLLANDTDADSDTLSIMSVTNGGHGTVYNNGDGTISYEPDDNYFGSDSFIYIVSDGNGSTDIVTVNVIVEAVNDDPASADDIYSISEDSIIEFSDLVDNDTDIDSAGLIVVSVTQPKNGTVTDSGNGSFVYVPDQDYNGIDSFTYTVSDGDGGTSIATVVIDIAPIEDAPVASNDIIMLDSDKVLLDNIMVNDYDPDGDDISLVSIGRPAVGYISTDFLGRTVYVSPANYDGIDTLTYTIADSNGNLSTGEITVIKTSPVIEEPVGDSIYTRPIPEPDPVPDPVDSAPIDDSDTSDGSQDITVTDNSSQDSIENAVVTDALYPTVNIPDNNVIEEQVETVSVSNDEINADDNVNTGVIESSSDGSSLTFVMEVAESVQSAQETQFAIVSDFTESTSVSSEQGAQSESVSNQTAESVAEQAVEEQAQEALNSEVQVAAENSSESSSEQQLDENAESEGAESESTDEQGKASGDSSHNGHASHNSPSQAAKNVKKIQYKAGHVSATNSVSPVSDISSRSQTGLFDQDFALSDSGVLSGLTEGGSDSLDSYDIISSILSSQNGSYSANEKANENGDFGPEFAMPEEVDFTVIASTVGSVTAGIAIAQGGASVASMSKTYTVINAIDPTPVINNLASSTGLPSLGSLGSADLLKMLKL